MQTHPYCVRVSLCVCSDANLSPSWGTVWKNKLLYADNNPPAYNVYTFNVYLPVPFIYGLFELKSRKSLSVSGFWWFLANVWSDNIASSTLLLFFVVCSLGTKVVILFPVFDCASGGFRKSQVQTGPSASTTVFLIPSNLCFNMLLIYLPANVK